MSEATTYRSQHIAQQDSAGSRSIMFSESARLAVFGAGGFLKTELLTIGPGGPTIGRVASTGHEIDLQDAETVTFLLPSTGRLDLRIAGQDYRLGARRAMAFRPTARRTRALADGSGRFLASTLQVPLARLAGLAQAAEVPLDLAFAQDGTALDGPSGQYLIQALPQLAGDLFLRPLLPLPPRAATAIGHFVDEQLCALLGQITEQTTQRRVLPAFHRVQQAVDMMHDQSDEPLSILEIARVLGISLRSLQLAFAEVFEGLSPRDVLNRIRLEKVRARLLSAQGEAHVTTAALDSGFFHLGRFSQAYARAYGEKPSETLARRRA